MPDPFDLTQYNTSFLKVSSYEPQAFEFADFSTVFAAVAESIKARQAGISIGYVIPSTSFINADVFDTTNPNGLSDSIIRFQDAVREFVEGFLVDEYGKLSNCDVHIGFFHYSNGLPIYGVQSVAPNGVDFTVPPDPAIITKPVEFAQSIGACINEVIYALNILRYLHSKLSYAYPLDEVCTEGPVSPPTGNDCPPVNDTICGAFELNIRANNCEPFVGIRCVNGTNVCALKNETNPQSPNVWYKATIPSETEFCGNFWGEYLLLKFTVTQNDAPVQYDPDPNFLMRVYRARPNCSNIEVHPFYVSTGANPVGVCPRQGEQYFVEVYGSSVDFTNNFVLCYEFINCIPGYEFSQIILPPPVVYGCTDPNCTNFNPAATVDDGSCSGCTTPPVPVYGCTDPAANNYNPLATIDDGSCSYSPPPPPPPPPPPISPPPPPPISPPPPPPPPPPTEGCFLYGTQILMADGSTKNIEDIVVGDQVIAYNLTNFAEVANKELALAAEFLDITQNSFVPANVSSTRKGQENYYYIINNVMKVTFEHPIFVKIFDRWRFIEARNLRVGYKMLQNDSQEIEIESITRVNSIVQTANLTIQTYATFVAESFVVHNLETGSSGSSGSPPTTSISDAKDDVVTNAVTSIAVSSNNSSIGGLSGEI